MTTLNAAEFIPRESTMGTVDEGKYADLVLLDAIRYRTVTNLDKIFGVVLDKYRVRSRKAGIADMGRRS